MAEEVPINATCGGCKKVFKVPRNGSLECPICHYCKEEKIVKEETVVE